MKPILILGLGNPLQGDDGVGCRVIETLARQVLPEDAEALDGGTPGVGLLRLFEGRSRVIIVDAAEMGEPPGTIRLFRQPELDSIDSQARVSLHSHGVVDALQLAHGLDLPIRDIILVGVQPWRVDWGDELSEPVHAAIPQLIEVVLREARADHGA